MPLRNYTLTHSLTHSLTKAVVCDVTSRTTAGMTDVWVIVYTVVFNWSLEGLLLWSCARQQCERPVGDSWASCFTVPDSAEGWVELVTLSRWFIRRQTGRPTHPSTNRADVEQLSTIIIRYDTIRYDSVYLRCSKKLTSSQLSLPHGTNKKLKRETKNKLKNAIGPV